MKKKWTVRPQQLWNPIAIEQWLEDEAANGWKLSSYNGWFAVMERTEPKNCRIRLQAHDPEAREVWQERVTAYEEMGWKYIGSVARRLDTNYEAYCCEDPTVPELDNDPVVYGLAWERHLKRAWWSAWLLLLIPLLVPALLVLAWDGSLLQMLLSTPLPLMYALLVGCPLLAAMCIRQLLGVRRIRRQLMSGVGSDRKGNWKRDRLWWRVITWVFLVYWIVYMGAMVLDIQLIPDDRPRPFMLSETTLLPESREEDWTLEEYIAKATPMRPLLFRVQMCTTEQRRVQNRAEHVRFEFLAELVYRETLGDFVHDWPEATQRELDTSVVDEAVLLQGGEDVQMLLVRSGKTVYSLWVNFPADLTKYVDSVARLMGTEG